VARSGKTDPVLVCLDSDVLIAGLLSRAGASHAILVLGEVGLFTLVVPEAALDEVRRNLGTKLPDALPLFETFLRAVAVRVHRLTDRDRARARPLADARDVPIMAAALGSGARFLVTHNVRHFRSSEGVRVVRPKTLIEEARAWMAALGREG
jgi:predicted nucleic acid-binding protein